MNNKTIVILISTLGVLALIAAIATVYAKNKGKNTEAENKLTPGVASPVGSTKTTKALDYNRNLGVGTKGEEVKALQSILNGSGKVSTPLVVDGAFGAKTLNAVILVMGFGTASTTLNKINAKLSGTKDTSSPETKSLLERTLGIKF